MHIIAKYNRRGDVVMHCYRHLERQGEMRIVIALKGTLSVHGLNYVTSYIYIIAFCGHPKARDGA